ncbi:hypothetical protein HOLleu_38459 [Holothuria leucospilota]|uniref:Uncharacterized protein n=1 Tax=Holothuria leucospilota TaxID=206669 RepID=A0A9Q0YH26_HOLLE|nr:hypothetical protein HOLleu_38459 [Holothuria leucospilota]
MFPASSMAVTATIVEPAENWLSTGDIRIAGLGSRASLAVTGNAIVTVCWFGGRSPVMSAGQLAVGGSVSTKAMNKNRKVSIFPDASVAVTLTGVMPAGKLLLSGTLITIGLTSRLSVTVNCGTVTIS